MPPSGQNGTARPEPEAPGELQRSLNNGRDFGRTVGCRCRTLVGRTTSPIVLRARLRRRGEAGPVSPRGLGAAAGLNQCPLGSGIWAVTTRGEAALRSGHHVEAG